MSNENLIQTGRALLDALNQHDLTIWASQLAGDFVAEYPGARGIGQEQAAMFNQAFLVAFPDLAFTVHHLVANSDTVMIHWTGAGTHTGPLATATGQMVPPSGRKGALTGVFVTQVRDGKIVKEQTYWDQAELAVIIGLAP